MHDHMAAPATVARDIPDNIDHPSRWARLKAKLTGNQASGGQEPAAPDHPEAAGPPQPPAPTTTPAAQPAPRRVNEWADRRKPLAVPASPPAAGRSPWAVLGVALLGLLVLAIVAVGLSVSLGPLRDTAVAVHIDPTAASLWWIGVDGLVVVAIIAALVLRHDPWARWYALGVVVFFTAASGFLQFLHGLGLTAPDRAAGGDPTLPKAVVALVAALVIGTIFCATHLLVYVLRHLFPNAMHDQGKHLSANPEHAAPEGTESGSGDSDTEDGPEDNDRPDKPLLDEVTEREVRKWFAAIAVHMILDAGGKPIRKKIAGSFEIADRQAGYVIADVTADREEAAERKAREAEEAKAPLTPPAPPKQPVGSVNGSGPTGSGNAP